jgi:Ser/Thr protein kinase RdoA (MazF antagonist)
MAEMSVPLGSYAKWQLSQPSTPRSELAGIVRRAVGSDLVQADRILEGYSNEVYRVRCADDQDVVVRILRFDDDVSWEAAAGEAEAINRARAGGVPAPEILLLDTVRIDGSEFPVMVQRTVAGRPLAEVIDRLSDRQRQGVLAEIGELIARLNTIPVDGHPDWPTAMAAALADRSAERNEILAGGFSSPEVDEMLNLLQVYVRDFGCDHWVLCHGDLSLKHIFVISDSADDADIRVSGVIDFGDWKPGAPVHDLAVLRVREPQLDLASLLAGYGAPVEQGFRRRLDLHTLMIALGSLSFVVKENDQAAIARSAHQVRTLIDHLADR